MFREHLALEAPPQPIVLTPNVKTKTELRKSRDPFKSRVLFVPSLRIQGRQREIRRPESVPAHAGGASPGAPGSPNSPDF